MSPANDFSQAAFPPFVNQLLQSGYLTLPQVQQALIEQRQSQRSLTEIIETITGRLLPSDILQQYRKEQLFNLKILYGVDVVDPETETIPWSAIDILLKSLIPLEICREYQILPLAKHNRASLSITLAMVNPDRSQTLDDLRRMLKSDNIQFERKVITQQDYNKLLEQYHEQIKSYAPQRQLKEQDLETFVEIVDELEVKPYPNPQKQPTRSNTALIDRAKQEFIVTLVSKILTKAVEYRASEIHFEPHARNLIVRFRQDGILRTACEPLAQKIGDAVIDRLKLLANRTGKIQQTLLGRRVNFDIKLLPSQSGEKVILRVFDPQIPLPTLEQLVVLEPMRKTLKHLLNRPSGLSILTGANGCGKTTTFYSLLNERNRNGINLSTVEDPIERTLEGITQVEVDVEQGRDYLTVLQLFLNQEADVIGIDRIQDPQTAKAAIEAAMSGHLVITSLPVDDATSAIAYLDRMGISPASMAESLIGIIDQRLLRRLCPTCRLSYTPSALEMTQLNLADDIKKIPTLYKPNRLTSSEIDRAKRDSTICPQCQGVGYSGNVAVFEILPITSRLKTLIAQNAEPAILRQTAIQDGMKSLLAYAQELVIEGETTIAEIERVLPESLAEQSSQLQTQVAFTQISDEPVLSNSVSNAQKIAERLQEVEKLLALLGHEFEILKREFQGDLQPAVTSSTNKSTPSNTVYELQDARHWETLVQGIVSNKDTMISDAYEELTDPGDWEQLREELEPDKETIVSDFADDEPSDWSPKPTTRSIPDPWS